MFSPLSTYLYNNYLPIISLYKAVLSEQFSVASVQLTILLVSSVLSITDFISSISYSAGSSKKAFRIVIDILSAALLFASAALLLPSAVPATQNVFKYTQTHREIKVLADTSYCFDVYALAIVNNTLLTSSCTLHSRKFLR